MKKIALHKVCDYFYIDMKGNIRQLPKIAKNCVNKNFASNYITPILIMFPIPKYSYMFVL